MRRSGGETRLVSPIVLDGRRDLQRLLDLTEAARMPVGTDEERADLLLSVRRFAIKHGSEDAC
jgi:hypothetical protein